MFKADRLSYLYSAIITQKNMNAENKRFGGFGDTPSTNPLSEVLGGVYNIPQTVYFLRSYFFGLLSQNTDRIIGLP